MLSGCIGNAWPPLAVVWYAAVNVTVVIDSSKRTSRGLPPCIVLLELGCITRTVSDREETIQRGTYRRPSPPLRLVQTEPCQRAALMLYVNRWLEAEIIYTTIIPVILEGEFVFVFTTHKDDLNASCYQLLGIYHIREIEQAWG